MPVHSDSVIHIIAHGPPRSVCEWLKRDFYFGMKKDIINSTSDENTPRSGQLYRTSKGVTKTIKTMERKDFFTQEFYENPNLTLDIMNQLVEGDHVADMDMYQSGTFLFMEVYDNDETKKILAPVISDLETYKEYNNKNYFSDETTQIGLCALFDEHSDVFFKQGKEIMWDNDCRQFVFQDDFMDYD